MYTVAMYSSQHSSLSRPVFGIGSA